MAIFDRPSMEPLPEADFEDVKHTAGKAFASLVPGVSELWGLVLAAPIEKRRDDWLRDLESRLRELEKRIDGFRFEDLSQNEEFVSAMMQATQAALKTHQTEKIEALRNAVINVALHNEPDADRQQQFVAMVDRFTATHLSLLRFFNDPAGYFQAQGRAAPLIQPQDREPVIKLLAYQLVTDAMPNIREQVRSPDGDRTAAAFQFIEGTISDLVFAKLISLDRHQETWSVPKFDRSPVPTPVKPLITHLGEDFLAFISDEAGKPTT